MPHLLEHFFRQFPHPVVIVDDKNTKLIQRPHSACSELTHVRRGGRSREPQMDRSAFLECAFDGSCPTDLSRKDIHHGKTQPTTRPRPFGREERVGCPGHDAVQHARSWVYDRAQYVIRWV